MMRRYVSSKPRLCISSYKLKSCMIDRRGNAVLIGFTIMNCGIFAFAKAYYILRNRYRDKIWNAMSKEVRVEQFNGNSIIEEYILQEQKLYLATTKDVGNKRLDFRFEH